MTALRDADHIAWEADARSPDPTPLPREIQGDEDYRLYRLCPCENCKGTGKVESGPPRRFNRCKVCRGEGRALDLVATCGSPAAVGVALITLADEGEFDECPVGIMHRPVGEKGVWKILPWLPSTRNVSDAAKLLRAQR